MKDTWEKAYEYASMPVHGTLSGKLRKGVKIQINEGAVYESAGLFLGEEFVRVTEEAADGGAVNNYYYDCAKIDNIRTYSSKE